MTGLVNDALGLAGLVALLNWIVTRPFEHATANPGGRADRALRRLFVPLVPHARRAKLRGDLYDRIRSQSQWN